MTDNIFAYALSVLCIILIFTTFIKRRNKGMINLAIFSLYTSPLYYLLFMKGAGGAAFTWWLYLLIITSVHITYLTFEIFNIYKKGNYGK